MKRPHDEVGAPSPHDVRAGAGRALVLGGGGAAGNAWLIGVLAGLFEAGLDVTDADVMIGTSAGSTVAAQLIGAGPTGLLDAILSAPAGAPQRRPIDSARSAEGGRPVTSHLERLAAIIAESEGQADYRRRIGAALIADPASDDAAQERWRATVAARFPSRDWPARRLLITAVDAESGEPAVFDRASGVDLVDAVAASCAGGFAYRIGERRFIDGGYRTNADNADLAAGAARVLVLSPLGGKSLAPEAWGTNLSAQLVRLRAQGSRVETVFPDADSLAAFGTNMMDPSTRPAAAQAGQAQGIALGERIAESWS